MVSHAIVFLATSLLMTACAVTEIPKVPADHPANPAAEAAPAPEPSSILTVNKPVYAPPPMGDHHHYMDMDGGDM